MNARDLLLMRNRADSLHALRDAFRGNVPGLHLVALTEQQNAVYQLMWQDSAGTTLVSAVEQPVGKWVCPFTGRFVSQASAGARPTYTRRVNLLTNTEFSGAVAGTPGTAPTGYSFAVSGGTTAIPASGSLTLSATAGNRQCLNSPSVTLAANASYTFTVDIDAVSGAAAHQIFGVVVTAGSVSGTPDITVAAGTGRKAMTVTAGASGATLNVRMGPGSYGATAQDTSVTFRRPDFRPASIAALNIPAYQGVRSSTDYDTEGFPPMVRGNGTSQWMSGTLDMSSTDKVLVVAGVTKYSDAATAPVFELTANAAATNGAFNMLAPTNGGLARLGGSTRGSAMGTTTNCFIGNASPYGHAAPLPAVVALSFNNAAAAAADQASMRVNSGTPITGTTSDGVGPTTTGNYANSTIYLLSRGGASLFSSAGITSLTIRGGDGSAWVSRLENYVKNLMKLVY